MGTDPESVLRAARETLAIADDKLLEVYQVAHRLRVCERTVYRWCLTGRVVAIKTPGGRWRVSESSLTGHMRTNKDIGPSDQP